MTVFVPRTAPGDRVAVEVVDRRKRYARAVVSSLVHPAGCRTEPLCRHYVEDMCGGCQLQHLDTDGQLDVKRRIIGDALRRIGHLDLPDPDIVPAPKQWRYRSKVSLTAKHGRIGYRRLGSPDDVFDLDDCPLAQPRLMELWRDLREFRGLFPGGLTALVLRGDREGGLHVVVSSDREEAWDASKLAAVIGREEVSYWWHPPHGAARVVAGPRTGYPALAFEQTHPPFARIVRARAVTSLGSIAGRTAWDLYGGVGDTALLLADGGASIWSVDADRSAVQWARRRSEQLGLEIHFVARRVEDALQELPDPDVVVVNPPRGGLARSVTDRLRGWGGAVAGRRLAYLSCDPATLARDLARLDTLVVADVTAFDLFPQTSHVETLVTLESR